MGDLWGVLLAIVLLLANGFFVGAEFALISARRDRLEALEDLDRARVVIGWLARVRAGLEQVGH